MRRRGWNPVSGLVNRLISAVGSCVSVGTGVVGNKDTTGRERTGPCTRYSRLVGEGMVRQMHGQMDKWTNRWMDLDSVSTVWMKNSILTLI